MRRFCFFCFIARVLDPINASGRDPGWCGRLEMRGIHSEWRMLASSHDRRWTRLLVYCACMLRTENAYFAARDRLSRISRSDREDANQAPRGDLSGESLVRRLLRDVSSSAEPTGPARISSETGHTICQIKS